MSRSESAECSEPYGSCASELGKHKPQADPWNTRRNVRVSADVALARLVRSSEVRSIILRREAAAMTLLWFIVWLIADLIGDHESLLFAPPNPWTATLILAIALDINRPPIAGRKT